MTRMSILPVLAVLAAGCASDGADARRNEEQVPRSTYKLQPEKVPERLRPLVPLAEKWGIGDDVERAEWIQQASAADRQALISGIRPYQSEITAWLDSFGTNPMTDEAAAFMYMQLAVEEIGRY